MEKVLLIMISLACVGSVTAHQYGEWIIDRCGALTGIGVRHRVCRECGDCQHELFDGPGHRLTVSILGDSYSTFKGWIPEGGITWYGDSTRECWNWTNVHEVEQMWWYILLNSLNADLCVNHSWSGTTICDFGYDGANVVDTSYLARTGALGESPDLILVFGGTNDAWAGAPLGSLSGDTTRRPLRSFSPAVVRMCDELDRNYPNSQKIMVLNDFLNHEGHSVYVSIMRQVAEAHGWKVCDVDIVNCNSYNHPTQQGMRLIAAAVEAELLRDTEWTVGDDRLGEVMMIVERQGVGEYGVDLQQADCLSETEVHYTLDGSEPTTNSLRYAGQIHVLAPMRLRARAFHPTLDPSPEVSRYFGVPLTCPTDEWWESHPTLLAQLGGVRDASLPSPGSDGQGKRKSDGTLYTIWDDFLCGTDPEDSQSLFKAMISMNGHVPVVSWRPLLSKEDTELRNYVIWGATDPKGPWRPIDPMMTTCRFFRVSVEAW